MEATAQPQHSTEDGHTEDTEYSLSPAQAASSPLWWEVALFRLLNAVMVVFFLAATVKLQGDDNACLWVPTFLVPAFLSTIVAVRPQLSGFRHYPVRGLCT